MSLAENVEKAPRTLAEVPSGERGRIVAIEGGHGLQSRLTAMGLLPETAFQVIRNGGKGPLMVMARESRVVLGRGMAEKVIVA